MSENKKEIRIVLADDHQIFLEALARSIADNSLFHIVGTCTNGDDLIRLIEKQAPDIAIADISMPGPGLKAIANTVGSLNTKIIALTMHLEPSLAHELLMQGIHGYVVKEAAFNELLGAIQTVVNGDQYLCQAITEATGQSLMLTSRERECLSAAAQGKTAKMIARELNISERTVRFHFANACHKMNVQKVTEAVAIALKKHIITA